MPGAVLEVVKSLPRVRSEGRMRNSACEELGTDILSTVDWVQDLCSQDGTHLVATCGAMSDSAKETGVDPDHLFLSMLRQRLIDDICFMWNPGQQVFHTLVALGSDIAGGFEMWPFGFRPYLAS